MSGLGAEGVGLLGAPQLCEGIRGHVSPNECILFDIDISGDDGQPNTHHWSRSRWSKIVETMANDDSSQFTEESPVLAKAPSE